MLAIIAAGIGTGLMMGVLGGGGSIISLPVLLYLKIEPKSAIAMSLGIVAVTAAISAFQHWRQGNVHLKVTGVFGALGAVGTVIGARLGLLTPEVIQLGVFALVMYTVAWRMLRHKGSSGSLAVATGNKLDVDVEGLPYGRVAVHGIGVGVLAGAVGIGGGFLIVPALVLLSGLSVKRAIGTSLSVVAIQTAAGFAGYVGTIPIDYPLMAGFTGVAVLSSLTAGFFSHRLPSEKLKRGFGLFLVVVATDILIKHLI